MATVLLVEDNVHFQDVCRVYLEHVGYAVLSAGDARTGIALARRHAPDLILMDIALPGMDGLEAVRLLKEDPDTASIPVVALTAQSSPAVAERCRQVGCDGFLAKPMSPKDLGVEVKRLLGES